MHIYYIYICIYTYNVILKSPLSCIILEPGLYLFPPFDQPIKGLRKPWAHLVTHISHMKANQQPHN